jgi:osmotically-inducible protein OsmY/sporulation protein YlmC with PRC-barrel domain
MNKVYPGSSYSPPNNHQIHPYQEGGFLLRRRTWALWLGVLLSVTASAEDSQWTIETARLGLMKQTSDLLGKKSIDQNGKTVGKIRDLAFDLRTGRVVATLISASKGQLIPVPATSYTFASRDKLVIGAERQAFKSAPRFPKGTVIDGLDEKSLAPSFQYFNQTLVGTQDGTPSQLCSSAGLIGARLLSPENETLGKVKDIMVDLLHGRIVYLVIEPAPNVAVQRELFALPPISVRPDPARRAILLAGERAHFLAGPRFPKEFWTDLVFPEMAVNVCRHYGLEAAVPAALTRSGSEAATQSLVAGVPTPQQRSDAEITQAVLSELLRNGAGFVRLDVTVTTRNGRVTLAGRAKDQKQKQEILAAAERVAGIGNVEDQLDAPGKKTTAQL